MEKQEKENKEQKEQKEKQEKKELKELKEVLLNCPCPPDCQCGNKKNKQWCHKICKTRSYLNNMGDIYCEQHKKDETKCLPYFIQHAKFKCSKQTTKHKFTYMSDFLMALSQALKAVEINMNDYDIQTFILNLNIQVAKRWKM